MSDKVCQKYKPNSSKCDNYFEGTNEMCKTDYNAFFNGERTSLVALERNRVYNSAVPYSAGQSCSKVRKRHNDRLSSCY